MDYRELWTDPEFMATVVEYLEAHVEKCARWDFDSSWQNSDRLAADAHKIAGSAGMYGFEDVSDSARALETAIRGDGIREEAQLLFDDLKARIAAAAEELAAYRAASGQ